MSGQTQSLLMVALPYAAIVVFIAGVIWRRRSRYTVTSLSSQILESRALPFGSVPFHAGIAVVVLGHLVPLLAPQWWQQLVSNRTTLLTVEAIGMAAGILALGGLIVLLLRRAISPAVRAGASVADFVVLAILIAQVALGLGVATMHRWGAVWSVRTTTPYLWSIFTLQPEQAYVAGSPTLLTLHIAGAWIVLALIPFTRLIHMFSLPLQYLGRPPQRVVWLTRRKKARGAGAVARPLSHRHDHQLQPRAQ